MQKIKQREIADLLAAAHNRCGKMIAHYRNYQPTLNHEAALKDIAETQRFLDEAKQKILAVHQPNIEPEPQLKQANVSSSAPEQKAKKKGEGDSFFSSWDKVIKSL